MVVIQSCIKTVDLNALRYNAKIIRNVISGKGLIAVVKSNAYGAGLIPAVYALNGACCAFAVADIEEARRARLATRKPILILMPVGAETKIYPSDHFVYTVGCVRDVHCLVRALNGRRACVHIKIDTGMHRLGITQDGLSQLLHVLLNCCKLTVSGVYTHFCSGEKGYLRQAQKLFSCAVDKVKKQFPSVLAHAAASATFTNSAMQYDAVRVGYALYGGCELLSLPPVIRLSAQIIAMKKLKKGERIGYDLTFCATRDMLIGIIGCGYADGYFRAFSGCGCVEVSGRICPVVGRVCMNMLFVDLTAARARVGDSVLLYGGSETSYRSLAQKIGFSPYELLTSTNQCREVRYVYRKDIGKKALSSFKS
ncbi:MAG: alanine racemase [Clostridia bacterium]|nr:alanine racemase [Clostridia bacterium]